MKSVLQLAPFYRHKNKAESDLGGAKIHGLSDSGVCAKFHYYQSDYYYMKK